MEASRAAAAGWRRGRGCDGRERASERSAGRCGGIDAVMQRKRKSGTNAEERGPLILQEDPSSNLSLRLFRTHHHHYAFFKISKDTTVTLVCFSPCIEAAFLDSSGKNIISLN